MQENIDLVELEKSLTTLKGLTEKIDKTLTNVNGIVKENINTGVGIWDSDLASLYRTRWDLLAENFPDIINMFNTQAVNLETFITNMKKVGE